MRCPKCGYISFDHLENCKKCRKAIGQLSEELNGTAYDAAVPVFLNIVEEEAFEEFEGELEETVDPMQEVSLGGMNEQEEAEDDFVLSLEPEEETVLDLGGPEEPSLDEEGLGDDIILSLDDLEEAAPREEFSLDLDEESPLEEEGIEPALDFSGLDISDLMPPGEQEPHIAEEAVETPSVEIEAPVLETVAAEAPQEMAVRTEPEAESSTLSQSIGLEDLSLDESHLDKVGPSAVGKRATRSVKTGTALDNFDVDLGELFSEEKK